MKRNFPSIFLPITLLAITANISAQNRSIHFTDEKWEQVLELAKKERKMIYLDCYTTWCGPCKWMAQNVFTNDSAADFYNSNFINVKIDMEKEEGPVLVKKYGIRSYPTMLYLSFDGTQLHRTEGKITVQRFIQNGEDAQDPDKQLASFALKFWNDTSNAEIAEAYLKMLKNVSQPNFKELEAYLSTQKESDLLDRKNWKIIYDYLPNASGRIKGNSLKVFNYLTTQKDRYIQLHGVDSVERVIDRTFNYELYYASKDSKKDDFEAIKKNYRNIFTKRSEQTIMYADLHYHQDHQEWNEYALTAIDYIQKYASKNMYELSGDAYLFYLYIENKEQLENAAFWAKQAVEMSSENLNFNEVYASLLVKLDKKEEAKAALERTIGLAKKAGSDYSDLQEMLDKIRK